MRRLGRQTPNTVSSSLNTRVTNLERRHTPDYPVWFSAIMDTITVGPTADNYPFGWAIPDDLDPDDPQNDELTFTTGDLLYLPVGWNGVMEITMTADLLGGGVWGDYRTVIPAPFHDQHGLSFIDFVVWVYEGSTQFSFSNLRSYRMHSEEPPPNFAWSTDRTWSYYAIWGGPLFLDEGQRIVLEPFFSLGDTTWGAVTASIGGLSMNVKRFAPGTGLTGFAA